MTDSESQRKKSELRCIAAVMPKEEFWKTENKIITSIDYWTVEVAPWGKWSKVGRIS